MDFRKLVCTKAQAEKLIELGIIVESSFFYSEICEDKSAVFMQVFDADEYTPAWTKEELDTMLGPGFIKPDFLEKKHNSKASDPLSYPIYYPNKQLSFRSGAQASAEVLIYLIEKGEIKAADACTRYLQLFS